MEAGSWIAAAVGLTAWLVLLGAAVSALLGALLASAGRMPLWSGVLVGVLGGPFGVLVLAVVALVRVAGAPAGATMTVAVRPVRGFRARRVETVLIVAVAAALTVAVFLDSAQLSAAGIPVFALPMLGTGLDALTFTSLFVLAGVAALVWWGAARWAAALAALLAGAWLALLGAVVAVWLPVRAALTQATTAGGTVGDAFTALGMRVDGAVVVLPDGGPLAFLGLAGQRIPVAGVDLGAVIPHLSLGLGTGILLLAAAAIVCAVLACVSFRRGIRRPSIEAS